MQSSTRFTLTLPLRDNDNRDLAKEHANLRFDLLAYFGGYTEHVADGGWMDNDDTYLDRGVCYTVDVPDDRDMSERRIITLARGILANTDQRAIYVTRMDDRGYATETVTLEPSGDWRDCLADETGEEY